MASSALDELKLGLESDRPKDCEDALKKLKILLDDPGFCSFLDDASHECHADPSPSTWPGLVGSACECIERFKKIEKGKSKSSPPKKKTTKKPNEEPARTLHKVIKRSLGPEKSVFLVARIRKIYEHLCKGIRNYPDYQNEYCSILSDLLESQYRMYLDQAKYQELVTFLISENSFSNLLPLLTFSPWCLPQTLREPVASFLYENIKEYSFSMGPLRKVLRAVTELLKRDGHSLHLQLLRIHSGFKRLFNNWSSTSGPEQDLLILYLKIQLKLKTIIEGEDGMKTLQEMLDFVVERVLSSGDNLKCSLVPVMRLSSLVIFQALTKCKNYSVHDAKRRKKESLPDLFNDRMNSSDLLWTGTFCFMVRHYHDKLPVEFFSDKLQPLLNRLQSESESVWTIRCLTELCNTRIPLSNDANVWQLVWNALHRRLPAISDPVLVLEEFKLLSFLLRKDRVEALIVPDNFWELSHFKQTPERGPLFFASSLSPYANFELRRTLLTWALNALNAKAMQNIPPRLLSAVFLALTVGTEAEASSLLPCWSDADKDQEAELEKLDAVEEVLGAPGPNSTVGARRTSVFLSIGQSKILLKSLSDGLRGSVNQLLNSRPQLEAYFSLCAVVSYCFTGMEAHHKARLSTWSDEGDVLEDLTVLVNSAIVHLNTSNSQAYEQFNERAAERLLEFVSMFAGKSFLFPADALLSSLEKRLRSIAEEKLRPSSFSDFDDELDHPNNLQSLRNARLVCISMITSLGKLLPEAAFRCLHGLTFAERKDLKVRHELILSLSRIFKAPSLILEIRNLVEVMAETLEAEVYIDTACLDVITGLEMILSELNASRSPLVTKELSVVVGILQQLMVERKLIVKVNRGKEKLEVKWRAVKTFDWRGRVVFGKLISALGTFDRDLVYPEFSSTFLEFLSDPEFRVRVQFASLLQHYFETSSEHENLLKDVHSTLSIKIPNSSRATLDTTEMPASAALIAFGEISAASEQVETEAVFTILSVAASQVDQRDLAEAVLDKLAKRLGYPGRQKYVKQVLGGVLNIWTSLSLPMSSLLEARELWAQKPDSDHSLMNLVPALLPLLLSREQATELEWIAQRASTSVKELVTAHFPAVYACLIASKSDTSKAFTFSGISKQARDQLLSHYLVSLPGYIICLVSVDAMQWPFLSKTEAVSIINSLFPKSSPKDQLKPNHVFEILLEVHRLFAGSFHWRHQRHCLAKLEILIEILQVAVSVPGTFRYLLHIIMEGIETCQLQSDCCSLISKMIQQLDDQSNWILGEQLQALVSKLVTCVMASDNSPSPSVLELLKRVTISADASLADYLKDLDQFPNLPCLKHLRDWQSKRFQFDTFSSKFVKFVQRAPFVPPQLRLWSLSSFCSQLREIKASRARSNATLATARWLSSDDAALSVWKLVFLCNEEDDEDARNLSAEILAVAGFGNLDAVAFHLPKTNVNFSLSSFLSDMNGDVDKLEVVLNQISIYLIDKDVSIIELASKTAQSLTATKEGKQALGKLSEPEKEYLKPHQITGGSSSTAIASSSEGNLSVLDDESIWSITGKTYDVWIATLVHHLISHSNDPVLLLCRELALLKASLAEILLPHVFISLTNRIKNGSVVYINIVNQIQTHIFSPDNTNTKSIQVFMDVLNQLRNCYIQSLVTPGTQPLPWPKVYWLDLDYLVTARAAEKCAAYFTSALYLDYWCEEKHKRLTVGDRYVSNEDELPEHLESMFSVFAKVNEPDSIYGLVNSQNPLIQATLYEHEGNWEQALKSYDLMLISGSDSDASSCNKGVTRALQRLAITSVAVKNTERFSNDKEFQELQFEDAWRTEKWELNFIADDPSQLGFHGNLHRSLQCLREGEMDKFQCHVKRMKQDLVLHVVHTSLESTQTVHPAIVKLVMVDCLSSAWTFRWLSGDTSAPAKPSDEQLQRLLSLWRDMLVRTFGNYNLVEPFGTFLKVLLRVVDRTDRLPFFLVELSKMARKAGRLHQAAKIIQELKILCKNNTDSEMFCVRRTEEAKVLWANGQEETAVNTLKHLLSISTKETPNTVTARVVAGKLLAQNNMARSHVILEDYFLKSVRISMSHETFVEQRSKAHYHLAHFANALYESNSERLQSSERQAALRLRKVKTKECKDLIAEAKTQEELGKKAVMLSRELKLDEKEDLQLHEDTATYLNICLTSYTACLINGDNYDMKVVFKLVSLWFKLQTNQDVVNRMQDCVEKVPSYKFVPLVYQIASRMGAIKAQNDFQHSLRMLVRKMATEHPYHCLYQILALANGDRVKKKAGVLSVDMEKKQAAMELLNELKGLRGDDLIQQMESLINGYITLAEHETTPEQQGQTLLLSDLVRGIRSLRASNVPVITANIPIDSSCKYDYFPMFDKFEKRITIMRGVNAPKVVECYGSDGRSYRQLAKSGGDDLRQDAVMEQLFGLVNCLLQEHPETRKRHLQVRTYKVVPFTPTAGVLEWVSGTMPLGDYLLGSSTKEPGAHFRYGGKDWDYMKCRAVMMKAPDKRKAFEEVCKNFRPVFRHFFWERFSRPADMFEKRLNYTRSLAANSMVGYIVGLGDRHSNNILIDTSTAEVVHIDLGVAFEQGLTLKSPETIPFRLTRDLVDGMGVTGVEGVFRRCCEATLAVLRANKEALLTIIEVFLHDPLYRWALSPTKALQKQQQVVVAEEVKSEEEGKGNRDAARALMRVKQKLDGLEGGEIRTVKGQVQQLIQDAQDPDRLCQLFPGWGAWM